MTLFISHLDFKFICFLINKRQGALKVECIKISSFCFTAPKDSEFSLTNRNVMETKSVFILIRKRIGELRAEEYSNNVSNVELLWQLLLFGVSLTFITNKSFERHLIHHSATACNQKKTNRAVSRWNGKYFLSLLHSTIDMINISIFCTSLQYQRVCYPKRVASQSDRTKRVSKVL